MPTLNLNARSMKLVSRPQPPRPTPAAVEHERTMWGPNPDKAIGKIEEAFYQVGFQFLRGLYAAALGTAAPRKLLKSLQDVPQKPTGWGDMSKLFRRGGDPDRLVADWTRIVDDLLGKLLPMHNQQEAAKALAVRAHLLAKIAAQAEDLSHLPPVDSFAMGMNPVAHEAMKWTYQRGLQHMKGLEEEARKTIMSVFIETRQSGEGTQKLQQRLFDKCSEMNKDWRRLAITETAMAVQNGKLASVDPVEGWEAEWFAAPNACPGCRRWAGQRFLVVPSDAKHKNGEKHVWVGKDNLGRSLAPRRKDGSMRTKAELWQPCIPAHPHCACTWVLHRIK